MKEVRSCTADGDRVEWSSQILCGNITDMLCDLKFCLPPCTKHTHTHLGEGSAFLSFCKGDLIHLENEDGEDVMKSGWCYGECERTGAKGDFPAECVYVLPAIAKPPSDVLVS